MKYLHVYHAAVADAHNDGTLPSESSYFRSKDGGRRYGNGGIRHHELVEMLVIDFWFRCKARARGQCRYCESYRRSGVLDCGNFQRGPEYKTVRVAQFRCSRCMSGIHCRIKSFLLVWVLFFSLTDCLNDGLVRYTDTRSYSQAN